MLNDLSWNVFRKTGDIETYLLMKELEAQDQQPDLSLSSADYQTKDSENLKG
ncbi:YqzL family protein [Halobacillus salinus]|uniref:YqzL family protein n=1 Tax=Halobacillus salinus TaxID=192814 RepID=A0A4Z0H9W2_9BACI|nr:YqzL family protein [Halobacillus salinus]TGB05455.1 YqzL family protein [Halobacillus salinus]